MYAIDQGFLYRVIHKSLRDFRLLRYSSRDGHAEGEHVSRGRGTTSFCPTLQLFLPHTCNVCGRNLITGLASAASPRVDVSSTCKLWQKLGVSLPLLTCCPSAWPSRLRYRWGWKSRTDLWSTLYKVRLSLNAFSWNLWPCNNISADSKPGMWPYSAKKWVKYGKKLILRPYVRYGYHSTYCNELYPKRCCFWYPDSQKWVKNYGSWR